MINDRLDGLLTSVVEIAGEIRYGLEHGIYNDDVEAQRILERFDDAADEAKFQFEELVENRAARIAEIDEEMERLQREREELGG